MQQVRNNKLESEHGQIGSVAARVIPSFAEMLFMVLAFYMVFLGREALLGDAGIGWHILNGENMFRTMSFTRVDTFSYTMAGKPWFAWEWLFDVVAAAVHHYSGLLGICIMTAIVFGACFAGLYQLLLIRSGDPLVSVALALLAAAASKLHLLARPHVFSWLFTVAALALLHFSKQRNVRYLYALPLLTLVWTNTHGSFPFVLVLIAIVILGEYLEGGGSAYLKALALSLAACAVVTLINPYGYHLHVHIVKYLTTPFFMDNIAEFQSPNFHQFTERLFIVLVGLFIVAVVYTRRRISPTELLFALFAVATALFAARDVPASSMLLAFVTAPLLSSAIRGRGGNSAIARCCRAIEGMSLDAAEVQRHLRGHLPSVVPTLVLLAIALMFGTKGPDAPFATHFPSKKFPVNAAAKMQELGIKQGVFAIDQWGSYLIYRLAPGYRAYFDDRHDFYGPEFVQAMLDVTMLKNWQAEMRARDVRWALIPPDSALAQTMRNAGWKEEYKDSMAVLLRRND